MDRRKFLTASLMTVAVFKGTGTGAAPGAAPVPAAAPPVRYQFSGARFRGMVGSRFQLTSAGWRGHVRLAEVREGPKTDSLDQFTTVFSCDDCAPPVPGIYDVDHPDTGRFPLRIDGVGGSGVRAATFALLRA